MRRIDYDIYRNTKQAEFLRRRLKLENLRSGRLPRQRPRDPVEEDVLTRLIRARFKRLIARGELKKMGPRNWRWQYPEFRSPHPGLPLS